MLECQASSEVNYFLAVSALSLVSPLERSVGVVIAIGFHAEEMVYSRLLLLATTGLVASEFKRVVQYPSLYSTSAPLSLCRMRIGCE